MLFATVLATLVASAAAKDGRTFAVMRFFGDGPLTTVRADPIINPGAPSSHLHTVMGSSNFGLNVTGEQLKESSCTNALIKNDKSAYWFPTLFFEDPKTGLFEQVEMFYMNVYYFFEGTNDQIKAFPTGLKMISGDATLRVAPTTDGKLQLDHSEGKTQPTQWTCPRGNFDPPSWPVGSDGSMAGIQDPNNKGSGMGFPFQECDGYASPLRMDLHFPSCYNPEAGLENYKENMQFPSSTGNGKQDCPTGWIHTPHIFFEVYWNTPKLADRWTRDGKTQPFILANGDRTGFSAHGDFIAAWDEPTLQTIIDGCDAGDKGMDKCPTIIGGLTDKSKSCNIAPMLDEVTTGALSALPGNNPPAGWGVGNTSGGGSGAGSGSSSNSPAPASSAPAAASSPAAESTPPAQQDPTTTLPDKVEDPTPTSSEAAATSDAPAQDPPQTTTVAQSSQPADGGMVTTTVWETSTRWATVYVTEVGPSPTAQGTAPASTATAGANATKPDVGGFKYAGCYLDARDRVANGEIRPNLGKVSNTNCVEHCASKGFSIAGTEYGGQCYCATSLVTATKLDESACSMACEGAADQTCGGNWALSLYTQNGTVSTGAASSGADNEKRHLHKHLHYRRGPSVRRR